MQAQKFFVFIACKLAAVRNCEKSGNEHWRQNHLADIEDAVKQHAPHGSGFDAGTALDTKASTPEALVFNTSYHHMDENGSYCGWSEHKVIVRASLVHGVTVDVKGQNLNDIKGYIAEQFHTLASVEVQQ